METRIAGESKRIQLLDILRGFALLLIVIIHYVEHFDFFAPAQQGLIFSSQTDQLVMNGVFALVSGKAYAIFALLFGYSCFIQINRKARAGVDFRGRYLWRLCILFAIGFAHSLVYKGDILHLYAALGLVLIGLYHVNSKVLIVICVLLALQIPSIYQLTQAVIDSTYDYQETFGMGIWHLVDQTYATGTLADVMNFNLWQGRTTVLGWTFYNGRYLQLVSLFILGLVLARYQFFETILQRKKAIPIFLVGCACAMVALMVLMSFVTDGLTAQQAKHLNLILGSYYNLAFTGVICASLIYLYLQFGTNKVHELLAAYGRMSLTNYLAQALFGVWFFYGFGLAMYQYMGATMSLILGVLVFSAQAYFSLWWQRRYRHGPVEWLWRSLTYIGHDSNVKKLVLSK
ncbi:DUF418 domain-containing protein [Neiella marina]|uniref:DUF418 domain-containing protein n=1 Tax=Neiella holothuriorum TaxID=2870530 RepID=A0ABS7EJV2_9GAMM|nr:DUF418 domain-containing protein [Neiella holothuriorum]MBW8192509.1 DUF418 domain-containing protein [Neiella holothuriorum]